MNINSKIKIQKIWLTDIEDDMFAKERFNSNNHGEQPDDYFQALEQTHTNKWVDQFHPFYHVINIDGSHLEWLTEAWYMGRYTRKVPEAFKDKIDELCEEMKSKPFYDSIFRSTGYFVRGESVSLKDSVHGIGPYHDFKSIVEALVTCRYKHSVLNDDHNDCNGVKLYLFPWIEIHDSLEFRIFVHNGKITCISQQDIYCRNKVLYGIGDYDDDEKRNEVCKKWVKLILDYFESKIKKSIKMNSYSIDLALIDGVKPYFIEANVFGKEHAAGSALFHWLKDEDKLYSDGSTVYFRYVL